MGRRAGYTGQESGAVAVGYEAGRSNQGIKAVAVGYEAGFSNQGINAVAIGASAGKTNQHDYSIVIAATGVPINSAAENSCHIVPIRSTSGIGSLKALYYEPSTGELFYLI